MVQTADGESATEEQLPEVVSRIVAAAREKNARDLALLDLRGSTDVTDYFLIGTADAEVHARAISDAIADALVPIGKKPWHVEGVSDLNWVLIDFVDIVAHVFREDAREFYGLEAIWADAPRVDISES